MKKKDNRFSRLNLNMKDYNEELEAILDEKGFDGDVQSLILSMFYKIENAYQDYYNVKKQMPSKEEFIKKISDTIKRYCNEIKIIKPKGKRNEIEYKIDKESGSIQCFPNEVLLLYCLFELAIIKYDKDDLKECAIVDLLQRGNSYNYQEAIRDFNGWSWTDSLNTTEEIQYNLIYQNLLMLLGYDDMQEILLAEKKIDKIKEKLESKYNQEIVADFLYNFSKIAVILKANNDKEYKEKLYEHYNPLAQELEKISDKEQLIEYIASKKKDITDNIREIDKLLNDITALRIEFEERNSKLPKNKKIFSISELADIYEEKREKLLNEMKDYNKLVEPMEYIKHKEELENDLKFFDELNIKEDKKNNIEKDIIKLQEEFLKCFSEKINKIQEKKKVIFLIYDFRYYCLLRYKKNYKIINSSKLKSSIVQVLKELIRKAEELKAIEKIFNDDLSSVAIFKKILQTRVITLENISLHIFKETDNYNIKFYDGNILEGEIDLDSNEINTKKKKVKLII